MTFEEWWRKTTISNPWSIGSANPYDIAFAAWNAGRMDIIIKLKRQEKNTDTVGQDFNGLTANGG